MTGNYESVTSYTLAQVERSSPSFIQQLDSSESIISPTRRAPISDFSLSSNSISFSSSSPDSFSSVPLTDSRPAQYAAQVPDTFLDFLASVPSSSLQSLPSYPFDFSYSDSHQYHPNNQEISLAFAMITEEEPPPSTVEVMDILTKTGKKYKPVALKTRPILGELADKFRIVRNIIGDPLANLPTLNPDPPKFTPTGRYTQERKALFDKANSGFLWPAERDLLHSS